MSSTPTNTKAIPMLIVKLICSLKINEDNSVTVATVPQVKMGCAMLRGNRTNAAA